MLVTACVWLLASGAALGESAASSVVVLRGTRVSLASFDGPGPAREHSLEPDSPNVEIHRGPRIPPEPRRPTPAPQPVVVYVVHETYLATPWIVGWPRAQRRAHIGPSPHHGFPPGRVVEPRVFPLAGLGPAPVVGSGHRGTPRRLPHAARRVR